MVATISALHIVNPTTTIAPIINSPYQVLSGVIYAVIIIQEILYKTRANKILCTVPFDLVVMTFLLRAIEVVSKSMNYKMKRKVGKYDPS